MKSLPIILVTLAAAVPATWFAARMLHPVPGSAPAAPGPSSESGERKPLYYQSAMHPWIKSDKPGRCTICGMNLTPVYEGDSGFDTARGDIVPLTQTMIQVMHVQTDVARVRPLRKTLVVAGVVDDNAMRHRVLAAYIPGRVQKLYANYIGAEVTEGQPLAEFYSPILLQAEREYRALSGELRAATALRLLQMGLTAAQIEALPGKSEDTLTSQILAPIGGTVVEKNLYEGQYVQEGETLFEIADFSVMWFQFRAYEQDLPWLRPGLKVDVTTALHPGKTFPGSIAFIDPNFDTTTRSTKARVELDNPMEGGRRLLPHRIYADGLVHLDAPEVLTVPRTAVLQTGPEALAYVDQGGGAYARRVLLLGRRGDTLVEVLSGLNAGDTVVVNGNLLLDGQAEMNRAFAAPASSAALTNLPVATPLALSDNERDAVKSFLALADAITASLAADNLAEFNAQASQTHTATPAVLAAFPGDSPWQALLKPLDSAGHLTKAEDLKSARKLFHPFSNVAVALAQAARRSDRAFASLKVFRCPMTKDAFAGAPDRAEWIQLQPLVRNPYFGAEMLDCGSEVKP